MIRIYERTSITEHWLSSVAQDSTGGGPLEVVSDDAQKVHSGILKNVFVSCDSTDFTLSIMSKLDNTSDSIEEIFRCENINLKISYDDLNQGWINNDTPRAGTLYAVVVNEDLQNPTGRVRIRLMNDINRRYSKGGN